MHIQYVKISHVLTSGDEKLGTQTNILWNSEVNFEPHLRRKITYLNLELPSSKHL